jgi:hypothetical protein
VTRDRILPIPSTGKQLTALANDRTFFVIESGPHARHRAHTGQFNAAWPT